MSSDFSAEITAIATAVLAAFAIITAVVAGLAFRRQSQEVGTLLEENKRLAAERRRAQASRVFTGTPYDSAGAVSPYVKNASDFPAYDAQLWYGYGEVPHDLGVILPGGQLASGLQLFPADAPERIALTFRDAEGVRWVRLPDGTFDEQSRATARDSALAAIGRNLPTRYDRQNTHITGPVLNMIDIYPSSHGILRLPGEYSSSNQPPEHKVDVATGRGGIHTAQRITGSPEHYTITYDVWNHRDSHTIAAIILTGDAGSSGHASP